MGLTVQRTELIILIQNRNLFFYTQAKDWNGNTLFPLKKVFYVLKYLCIM